jgi:hypothetical protein
VCMAPVIAHEMMTLLFMSYACSEASGAPS